MCNNKNGKKDEKGDEDMSKTLNKKEYRGLNLNEKTLQKISLTPKVKKGKMLFNRNNKNHRYIVNDED